jgi:RNA polymerase sigma factor (sigma-70 family)
MTPSEANGAQALLLAHLPLVERVTSFTCRRHHVGEADAEEFASVVKMKLLEDDYAVFRKFQGQSRLSTYLTTVIQRLFFDWLRARKGRPRPSAEARRMGTVAIQLERLLYWEGFSFDEACRLLQENHGVELSWRELEAMAGRLPPRAIERQHEGGERADALVGAVERPDEAALEREREGQAERVVAVLAEALEELGPEDRVILRMRFEDEFTVADIARGLHLEQKPLYRRIEGLKGQLRRGLEARGLRSAEGWWA